MAGGAGTGISKGGMITKVRAAQRAARSGAHLHRQRPRGRRAAARHPRQPIGTLLVAPAPAARKQWLADHPATGRQPDLRRRRSAKPQSGKSLLPIGVTAVEGDFNRGAVVACRTPDGREIARGPINYAANDARRIVATARRDREHSGLRGRNRTDPPGQPGADRLTSRHQKDGHPRVAIFSSALFRAAIPTRKRRQKRAPEGARCF